MSLAIDSAPLKLKVRCWNMPLSQKLPSDGEEEGQGGDVFSVSYSLVVDDHRAILEAHLEQVFEFTVQPIVSSSPDVQERIGAPVTFRSQGGGFVREAEVVTTGTLIHRIKTSGSLAQGDRSAVMWIEISCATSRGPTISTPRAGPTVRPPSQARRYFERTVYSWSSSTARTLALTPSSS